MLQCMFLKTGSTAWMVLLLLATACNRPSAPTTRSSTAAPAPFASADHPARADSPQLSAIVARIVATAHRSGSVVYRVECGPERSLAENRAVALSPAIEPMQEALDQLLRSYPGLKWNDSRNGVSVLDSRVSAGLLKVRIAEFTVIEDKNPETALAALWRTPEVIRYMAAHDVRLLPSDSAKQGRRSRTVIVIHVKNATVEQIVRRIAASYPNGASRFWSYRECQRGAETLVEVKIL